MSIMTTPIDTPVVTNDRVARDIKLSDSMVSRIRSGDRLPSFTAMELIEQAYNWPIEEQARARRQGNYAQAFEYRVTQHYAA